MSRERDFDWYRRRVTGPMDDARRSRTRHGLILLRDRRRVLPIVNIVGQVTKFIPNSPNIFRDIPSLLPSRLVQPMEVLKQPVHIMSEYFATSLGDGIEIAADGGSIAMWGAQRNTH